MKVVIDSITPATIHFTLVWPNGHRISGTVTQGGLDIKLRWNRERGLLLIAAMRAHPDYHIYEPDPWRRTLKQCIKFYEDRGWSAMHFIQKLNEAIRAGNLAWKPA